MRALMVEMRDGKSKYGKFTPEFAQKLTNEAIDAYLADLSRTFGEEQLGIGTKIHRADRMDLVSDRLKINVNDDPQHNNNELVNMLAVMAFTKQSSDMPVTFENVQKLFRYRKEIIKDIAELAKHPDAQIGQFSFNDYIEGEIFGGVDLTKDIEEVVLTEFDPDEFEDYEDRVAQLQEAGIKVTFKK